MLNEQYEIGDLAAAAGIRRVHVLAWRDLDDPEAGGSEVHADQVLRRWAAAGLEVTLRTSAVPDGPEVVERHGYRVIRRAGRYQVFPRSVLSELTRRAGPTDAVVEIWNGMPFLTPLWRRGPRLVVLHHVHAEMWQMVLGESAPWMARLGDAIERRLAPPLYRRSTVATLSTSSRLDIVERLGLDPQRIVVAPPGIDDRFVAASSPPTAAGPPEVLVVGRLVPVKRHDLLLQAVAVARRRVPDLVLTVVGDGYEQDRLQQLARSLDATSWVRFVGRVDDASLVAHYQRATLVASASAKEGWGMSLTEAAACGTPAVATRIAGHLDAVAHGTSGLLCDETPEALGRAIAAVAGDPALRARLSCGAQQHAEWFRWDRTALALMQALVGSAVAAAPWSVGTRVAEAVAPAPTLAVAGGSLPRSARSNRTGPARGTGGSEPTAADPA